jgi:hypothetical protein
MHRQGITGNQAVAVRMLVRPAHPWNIGKLRVVLTCRFVVCRGIDEHGRGASRGLSAGLA